jgi:hypothetical protein
MYVFVFHNNKAQIYFLFFFVNNKWQPLFIFKKKPPHQPYPNPRQKKYRSYYSLLNFNNHDLIKSKNMNSIPVCGAARTPFANTPL